MLYLPRIALLTLLNSRDIGRLSWGNSAQFCAAAALRLGGASTLELVENAVALAPRPRCFELRGQLQQRAFGAERADELNAER